MTTSVFSSRRDIPRIAGFLIVIMFLVWCVPVRANTGYDVDVKVDSGEVKYYSFDLAEGNGLYGRFRINYGQQIHFFIVDQDGHQAIESGTAASTAYLEKTYDRNNGSWYSWRFIATHNSTWYVYFSKAFGAPVTAETVSLEGYVRQDTDHLPSKPNFQREM